MAINLKLLSPTLLFASMLIIAALRAPVAEAVDTSEWGASYSVKSFQGDPTQMFAGETRTVTLQITNIGTKPWTAGGAQPVRLGVHFGTDSDEWHTGWATDQRFNIPSDVAPGASVELTVQVTAPTTTGSYVLRFRMLKEGVTWFNDIHKIPGVSVQGLTRSYTLAGITPVGTPMPFAGGTMRVNVTLVNTGTEAWNATGDGRVRLAIHFVANPDSDIPHERWATDDRFELTRNVPSYYLDQTNGQITLENLLVNLPRDPGDYTMHVRMVKEGVSWFDQRSDAKTTTTIQGLTRSYTLANVVASPGSTPIAPGETFSMSITIANTGTETWNATGDGRVRLGVQFSSPTASDEPHDGWATDQRWELTRDVPSVLLDPANGVITLENLQIKAPRQPGNYVLRIRMVKEGVSWFPQDPNAKAQVLVDGPIPPPEPDPQWRASYSSAPPTSWVVGQTRSYTVNVTNNGTQSWNASGDKPVHLGIHFGTASDTWHDSWATDLRVNLPHDVAPGESVGIPVSVTAPTNAGSYVLRHRMVKEQVTWFADIQKTDVSVAAN